MRQAVRYIGHLTAPTFFHVAALLALATCPGVAWAQGNVVMGLDAMIVNNSGGGQSGWGGFGRFSYGGNTIGASATLGRYGAFTVAEPGAAGSGVGVNFTVGNINTPIDSGTVISPITSSMFPLLDRATFGANFDPNLYVAELVYKPLAGNTATQLNMTVDTTDGFTSGGLRRGEQWQWGFTDLLTKYGAGTKDADGFVTVRNNGGVMSQAASFFHGLSYMYATAPLPTGQEGDALPDFNNFEGGALQVPNGVVQLHLQTDYTNAALVDNWEVKAVRIVKLAPDSREVARLDSHSGFSNRFGSPFRRGLSDPPITIGGTDYFPSDGNNGANTDQVSRFDQNGFTNIVLNTHDDAGLGGVVLSQPGNSVVFDATSATVDVKAKLTVPQGAGEADHIVLVVKDKDGNGTADPGDFGGDEYHYNLMLNQFNTSSMTTISVPISSFTKLQAQEFATPGDGLLTNFNLYMMGLQTDQGAGLVDVEIESIRVMLPPPPGVQGDYNGNGIVDAADYTVWRDHLGQTFALPNRSTLLSGPIAQSDYDFWKTRFGAISGAGASGAVPEPATWLLGLMAVCGLAAIRRRS